MSNILSQRWLISRRRLLQGAGASLALPLLNAMTPLLADNGTAQAKAPRCVFIYVPNGVNGMTWQIAQSGRGYEFSRTLKSLERHSDDLTIFSGLHHPNCLRQAHVCQDTWLTGAKADAESSRSYRNSVSCDQVIAEVTSRSTRIPSLELSIAAGTGTQPKSHALAFSRDGLPLPAEDSPHRVFDRLFGAPRNDAASQRTDLNRRKSVLDLVLEDARSLRQSLGHEDHSKLDEYLQSVREVEQRVVRLGSWLDVPPPVVDKQDAAPFQRDVPKTDAGEYYRTMFDLIVLALRTDMTRVVTYMSGLEGGGLAIPELGISQNRHMLSHHNGDPEVLEALARSDEFFIQQFAYFLDRLRLSFDGGEPLLESTMIVLGSGMSYGHSHSNANLPIVFAGGRGLGIRHGQHIDYNLPHVGNYTLGYEEWRTICRKPLDANARLSNLFLTVMHKMQVPAERFVDSVGPISEVV